MTDLLTRLMAAVLRARPGALLLGGYGFYMLVGCLLLALPFARTTDLALVDVVFVAVSAVSTTGLVTVDPGTTFTFGGQLMLLLLMQIGGIGYMTLGSFIVLSTQQRLSGVRARVVRTAFVLPQQILVASFIRTVVLFTLGCEVIGALLLWWAFRDAGVDDALWSAVFHAVSAFCTAGFSLYGDSFEAFRGHLGVNLVISALSLLGATGFLVVWDGLRSLADRSVRFGFTSRVILGATAALLLCSTIGLLLTDPTLRALPAGEALLAAWFQSMTAVTTVGFNTHPIGAFALAPLLLLMIVMVIGASPSGTGGGLKTTTAAVLVALVRSVTHKRSAVRFFGRRIPDAKVAMAAASFAYLVMLLMASVFLLSITEADVALEALLFEASSALGTVGLSTGVTGELSAAGKIVIIVLMTAGRVGILGFAMALALPEDAERVEEDEELLF